MTAVAARPIHDVPKSSPGVALTRDFTGCAARDSNPQIKSPLLYSIFLIDLYRIVPGRAVLCRSADDRGAGAYRSLPGRTGTAEQTWSNHGNRKV